MVNLGKKHQELLETNQNIQPDKNSKGFNANSCHEEKNTEIRQEFLCLQEKDKEILSLKQKIKDFDVIKRLNNCYKEF